MIIIMQHFMNVTMQIMNVLYKIFSKLEKLNMRWQRHQIKLFPRSITMSNLKWTETKRPIYKIIVCKLNLWNESV